MIWVILRGVDRPRLWLRAGVDIALAIGAAWLLYLAAGDRDPPWSDPVGSVVYERVRPGQIQEIAWDFTSNRYCQEVRVNRALVSAADLRRAWPLSEVIPVMSRKALRPVPVHGISHTAPIPADFPVNAKAYYRVTISAACNWLQALLPERWWIHDDWPVVEFWVSGPAESTPPR